MLQSNVFLDIDGAFDNASFGSMDAASMELFQPCVGGLMPCFAVEAFELTSGEAVSGCL
jgi:hypothetical protein